MLGAVLQCSATCGTGTRKRTVTCTNSQGKCDASTRPRAEEACEDHSGCYEWKTGDWSKVRPARLRIHPPAGGGASGRERAPGPRASVTAVTPEWPLAFQTPCLPVTPHGVRFQGNRRAPRAQGGVLRTLAPQGALARPPSQGPRNGEGALAEAHTQGRPHFRRVRDAWVRAGGRRQGSSPPLSSALGRQDQAALE